MKNEGIQSDVIFYCEKGIAKQIGTIQEEGWGGSGPRDLLFRSSRRTVSVIIAHACKAHADLQQSAPEIGAFSYAALTIIVKW